MNFDSFPEDFFWGASTSAHQVEGGNKNDWTVFENKNAISLAENAKKMNFFLDKFAQEAQKPSNYLSGSAADHLSNFDRDFYMARKMGLTAYRFSIEWSRIEPECGKFDREAIAFYKRMIRVMRTYNIEPFVTLWHWTLPVWFAREGGFRNSKNIKYFLRFVKKITIELKDDVRFFVTLNEPEIYAMNSYLRGIWPPRKRGAVNFYKTINNLVLAHIGSYSLIKKYAPHAQVGIAKNNSYFEIGKPNLNNKILVGFAKKYWNDYFLDKIASYQDFIGLNYYFRNRVDGWFYKNKNVRTSDLGWDLYPQGIYHVLNDLKKYKKPIYITENGLADAEDKYRSWFLDKTVESIGKAIGEGADVRGYLHWSLIDNFEWDKGFWPRFGLIEVDYRTQKRTLRNSALHYGEIIGSYNRSKLRHPLVK